MIRKALWVEKTKGNTEDIMKNSVLVVLITAICGALAASPASAKDLFDVAYRQINVPQDAAAASGYLLVTVRNMTGSEARDVAASVPEANTVTYDDRQVFIGTLAAGQRVEVMDAIGRAQEGMPSGDMAAEALWRIEFTDATGERKTVDVVGRKIQ